MTDQAPRARVGSSSVSGIGSHAAPRDSGCLCTESRGRGPSTDAHHSQSSKAAKFEANEYGRVEMSEMVTDRFDETGRGGR